MVEGVLREVADNLRRIATDPYIAAVEQAIELLVGGFHAGKKALIFGNGGSSADAQHICGELVGRFHRERRGLPAIALSANQAVMTAWANDHSFDTIFSRQIEALGCEGDVAWGISTSGNSPNVVNGLKVAREMGLRTFGMTGLGGGRMAAWCDVLAAVPLRSTPRIQELHLVTYHIICAAVEGRVFEDCVTGLVQSPCVPGDLFAAAANRY